VRNLAVRSAEAASEIDTIVTEVVNGAQAIFSNVKGAIQTLDDSKDHQEKASHVLVQSQTASEEAFTATSQIATAAAEQASVSADMAKNVLFIDDAMNRLQTSFSKITGNTESIRDVNVQVLSYLGSNVSPKMTLTLAKSDHIVWVDKLYRFAIYGQMTLSENELKDHHQCRLGKFLDGGGGEVLRQLKDFDYLYNQLHADVHATGIQLYKAALQTTGNVITVQQQQEADRLMKLSDEVVGILDQMIHQI